MGYEFLKGRLWLRKEIIKPFSDMQDTQYQCTKGFYNRKGVFRSHSEGKFNSLERGVSAHGL